jgi:hypothetical protein
MHEVSIPMLCRSQANLTWGIQSTTLHTQEIVTVRYSTNIKKLKNCKTVTRNQKLQSGNKLFCSALLDPNNACQKIVGVQIHVIVAFCKLASDDCMHHSQ